MLLAKVIDLHDDFITCFQIFCYNQIKIIIIYYAVCYIMRRC